MIKIDLISGFLGSGKTTFLKEYAKYCMKHENIGIIENDFGAINVDMMLLQDLNCELEMITGDQDKQTYYRRFKTKLIAMKMRGLDRVIIEPSGIYDIEDFFDVLHDEPLNQWYEIDNIMTIVDPQIIPTLSDISLKMFIHQVMNAGTVIVHPTSDELNDCLIHHNLTKEHIIYKDTQDLTDEDFYKIQHSGYDVAQSLPPITKQPYQTLFFMNNDCTLSKLQNMIQELFKDDCCGTLIRVKGFCKEDTWYDINATYQSIQIHPVEEGQDIIILIGEALNQAYIEDKWQKLKHV